MPKKKENTRIITYNKLVSIGKFNEKDILNLKIEDLKYITEDPDVLNIITLRKCIKEHNSLGYFNYKDKEERKEDN